jgi:hypothetical protein
MNRLWLALAAVLLVVALAGVRFVGEAGSGRAAAAPSDLAAAPEPAPQTLAELEMSAAERDAALREATDGDWSLDEFRDSPAPSQPAGTSGSAPSEVSSEEAGVPEITFFTPSASPQQFAVEGSGGSQTFGSQFPAEEDDGLSSDTVVRGDPAIRAAFYYPWFPEGWTQDGVFPFTAYHPSLGYYGSSDRSVVQRHIAAMQYGNIDAGIASWWGPGHYTDSAFAALLGEAGGTGFRWAVYYEAESLGNPTVGQIRSDLRYIDARYAHDPSYLKVDGRWVVFVYSTNEDRCEMAERWKDAALPNAFVVLKAFPHQNECAGQPDAWHYYNPLVYTAGLAPDSFAISPGYTKPGDEQTVARDLERWQESVREMASSTVRFQLILTFNEWGEGTSIESAEEWASPSGHGAYLDVLHAFP